MAQRVTVTNPVLTRLIAESKQVTEDLMVLRREAAAIASTRGDQRDRIDRANDRLRLVLDNVRALGNELHDHWMEATRLNYPESAPDLPEQLTLTNGQPRLVSGGR